MCLAAIYWARLDTIYYANSRSDAAEIDFDDDFLYREICQPLAARRIPMRRILADEALLVFNEWRDKVDKISY
jgi:tRNA(Arg) A34 adenosine deaminase TadA